MTQEQLNRACEITSTQKYISKIQDILRLPYPMISDRDNSIIGFERVDRETCDGLKKIMNEYLEKRYRELGTEFKSL